MSSVIEFLPDRAQVVSAASRSPWPVFVCVHPGPTDAGPRAWVARLGPPVTDADLRYGIARRFIRQERQLRSNAQVHKIFEPGIFEAQGFQIVENDLADPSWRVIFAINASGRLTIVADSNRADVRDFYQPIVEGGYNYLVDAPPDIDPIELDRFTVDPDPTPATPLPRRRITRAEP